VALVGGEAGHVGAAQPVAETVDQLGELGLAAAAALMPTPWGGQGELQRGQRVGDGGGQHHHLDARALIRAQVEFRQVLGQEAEQMAGRPRRPAGAERDPAHCAVAQVEAELEAAHAAVLALETAAEVLEQAAGAGGDVVEAPDGFGEGEALAPARHRPARRDRLAGPPQGLVEPPAHKRAEAPGEARARHRVEIADPAQAKARQPLACRHRQAQGPHRKTGQRFPGLARRDDGAGLGRVGVEAGHGPGGAGAVGEAAVAGEAEPA
jgi:hypothetical protein